MTLLVEVPPNYPEERDYILNIMLRDFLGLNFQVCRIDRADVRITAIGGEELVLADRLFQTPEEDWLTERSLPHQPVQFAAVPEALAERSGVAVSVPVVYGDASRSNTWWQFEGSTIRIGLDILGSAFFMLTRYEEVVRVERDERERFPAEASLAHQEGFLDRPVVNEYLELLWACLSKLWPQLERRRRRYRVFLSHDVDSPFSVADKPWPFALGRIGRDLLERKDANLAARRMYSRLARNPKRYDADPSNTFDFIMDINERYNVTSAFYFITDHSGGAIDGTYTMDMPWIRKLLRRIHHRGHEIGLHPSYNTFRDAAQTALEFERLLLAAEANGIQQDRWGGRQHFLRWEAPTTWQNWADAGLSYDSTLTYAGRPGFRCGVCYDYPTFNLRSRQRLQLREQPLIVMETSLMAKHHMRLGPQAALRRIIALGDTCKSYNGNMCVLWHNNELVAEWQKRLYLQTLEALV